MPLHERMQVGYIILWRVISKVMPLVYISIKGIINTIVTYISEPGMKVRLKMSMRFLINKNSILCTWDRGTDEGQSFEFEINICTEDGASNN